MSIEAQIRALVTRGDLVQVLARQASEAEIRRLYVAHWIDKHLMHKPKTREEQARLQSLRVDLEAFVYEGSLDNEYLKALEGGAGVLEVRSTYPKPQIRVFGGLVAADTLVLAQIRNRDELRRGGDAAWNAAIRQTQRSWNGLFGGNVPLLTDRLENLVTGYIGEGIPP